MSRRRDFRAKVVVITGAASGIGRALARRYARAGAQLALLDVDANAASALAAELGADGRSAVGIGCDVADETSCRHAVSSVVENLGGIDVLFNNAGITHRSVFAETETAVLRKVMSVNLFGAIHCTKAALPSLIARRGLIVVTSSIAGLAPLYERSGYAASKHALHGLFGSLRAELLGTGVDVMMICPGFTATGIGAAALDGSGQPARHAQSTIGRLATPEAVAEAVFDAASRSRRLLVLSAVGKATAILSRFFPSFYDKAMARSIRRQLERPDGEAAARSPDRARE
jgi:NAD(P)-dependent dehydrogenase (short-subunit alcohol dehydrogenase family)